MGSFNRDPAELIAGDSPASWGMDAFRPAWHSMAACAGMNDTVFFGNGDEKRRPPLSTAELRRAQRICFFCPVFTDCLAYALVSDERYGIWAGTSRRTRVKATVAIRSGKATVEDVVAQYSEAKDEIVRRWQRGQA